MISNLLSPTEFEIPFSQSDVVENLCGRGYPCWLFVDPPGQRWEDVVHICNEVVMVQYGRLGMEVSSVAVEMVPCDEIFIPKDAIPFVCNIHTGISKWLYSYDWSSDRSLIRAGDIAHITSHMDIIVLRSSATMVPGAKRTQVWTSFPVIRRDSSLST